MISIKFAIVLLIALIMLYSFLHFKDFSLIFVKSQGGIVEFHDGEVIADWKRET